LESAKRSLDAPNFARWLTDYAPTHAYVENGRSIPRQGLTSMFRYVRVWRAIKGLVVARSIPVTLIEPAAWKKFMHRNSSKRDCRARALQLLLGDAAELQRVRDHHRARQFWLGFYGLAKGTSA
jgi:hypothetical protein